MLTFFFAFLSSVSGKTLNFVAFHRLSGFLHILQACEYGAECAKNKGCKESGLR